MLLSGGLSVCGCRVCVSRSSGDEGSEEDGWWVGRTWEPGALGDEEGRAWELGALGDMEGRGLGVSSSGAS